MTYSTNIIRLLDKVEPSIKEVLIAILEEIERQRRQWEESVTKTEFNELKEIVRELGKKIEELAEAQKKTEQRVSRLEKVVEELAEAQKKTEEELRKLISEHRKTREQVGGLSHTVGYILEDRSYAALPHLLSKEFEIKVEEIKRDFVELASNRYEELNIIGKGRKNGTPVWILGECKTQLRKKDVDSFLKKISRIEHLFPGERLIIMVTYQTSPQVRNYVQQKGIKLYFSYQLQNVILSLL
ncbi:hypothetical protein JCM12298_31200 [Desulfothermus naphthae]